MTSPHPASGTRGGPSPFDGATVESLRRTGSYKWTEFGHGVLGAGAAEMDFSCAEPIVAALHQAVERGVLGYLPPALEAEARSACAEWQQAAYGWSVAAEDIRLLPDVVRALQVAIQHFSRPGSAVIVPTPAYPPFLQVPVLLGRPVIEVPLIRSGGRSSYDLAALDRAFLAGGHLLLHCSPHNPLGRVWDADELRALSEVVERHGGRVFSDEVHAPLVYPGRQHVPYASVSECSAGHAITATSASKAWNLPGLKCAQVLLSNAADRAHWQRLGRLATDGTSILGAIAQVAAFREGKPWLDQVVSYLDANRRRLADLASRLLPSVAHTMPEATYLGWLDCRDLPLGGMSPARYFHERAGVGVLDGANCGTAGAGFVRINFATAGSILDRIVTQLADSVAA